MVKLDISDKKKLLKLLELLPIFQTYGGRRALLTASGLERLLPQLELEGPSFIVASDIVQK